MIFFKIWKNLKEFANLIHWGVEDIQVIMFFFNAKSTNQFLIKEMIFYVYNSINFTWKYIAELSVFVLQNFHIFSELWTLLVSTRDCWSAAAPGLTVSRLDAGTEGRGHEASRFNYKDFFRETIYLFWHFQWRMNQRNGTLR